MAARDYALSRSCPLDPPEMLRELRGLPISKVRGWGGTEVWVATRHEDVNFILRDPRFSSDIEQPGFPKVGENRIDTWRYISSLGHLDDPRHGEIRQVLAEDFLPKRVAELRPRFERVVAATIDRVLATTPPIDFYQEIALPISSRMVIELVDMPAEYRQLFEERVGILLPSSTPKGPEISAVFAELYAGCEKLLNDSVTGHDDSLFTRIKTAVHTGRLELDEACRTIVNLTCIGHAITASAISMTTLMLLRDPALFGAIRKAGKVADNIIEELLRYHSPINYGVLRLAAEDVMVGGQLISKGDGVVVSLASANRDDSMFRCPDEFDIDRAGARRHMSFGHGGHVCLGQWLARAELQVTLSALATRIPTLRLAVPFEDISFTEEAYIFTVRELPVAW